MDESSSGAKDPMGEPRPAAARPRLRLRLSRASMLDRFELVLLLVLATIAVQGLIDVRGSVLAQLFTHAITGLALVAAVRASGIRRRWRRTADIIVGAVLLLSLVILIVHGTTRSPASRRRRPGCSPRASPRSSWHAGCSSTRS